MTVGTKMQLRRDTAAAWASANPVLDSGEVGIETDTLKVKIGNGAAAWTALAYGALRPADGITVVEHGSTASTARPAGAIRVFWRGTVTPSNMTVFDRLLDVSVPTAPVEKVCVSTNPVVLAALGSGAVTSVAGRTGAVVLAAGDVSGLGTAATANTTAFDAAGAAAAVTTTSIGAATATDLATETTNRTNADALLIPLSQKGVASGVAQLDSGGKIPAVQLPAITMNTVWPSVASQAAMLALTAEPGDVAVRSDIVANYMLASLPASTLANWALLNDATGAVTTVAGRTGNVTLAVADVTGAVNATQAAAAAPVQSVAGRTGAVTLVVADVTGAAPATGSTSYITVVEHGATAGTARPAGAVRVFWRGTVAPTNATQYDRWVDSSTTPYTESVYTGAAFTGLMSKGLTVNYAAKTAAYTITTSDHTVDVDATAGAVPITLPTAVGIAGQIFVVRKSDASTNAVTVGTASAQTINGAATYVIPARYQTVTLQSDGANWMVL